MTDFLLELRCEEIPARMQRDARTRIQHMFAERMSEAGVNFGDMTVWSTPRRLALIARNLPEQTEAVSAEEKGPPEGAPDQAIDGFCRKNGVTRDQLELRDVKGRMTYFAVKNIPGRAVKKVLAETIPEIVKHFGWPKSMRWGSASLSTESLRWVRPLSGIVAIFGEDLVECQVDGIASGFATKGHRFHHPDEITIGGADDYAEKLRACHVIVDHAERQDIVREGAAKAAAEAGLKLVEDEGLVVENAGLTEWPVPLLGRFDEAFLEVPPEVIQLTARVNQKYFVCEKDGKLANAFVCTANIDASDGGDAIVDGNRKVLAARLSDARFFWEQDRKTSLEDHAKKLERITFHEKLGTVADKVERVAKLARWLVEEGIVKGADADQAEQAARLCKADLVTEMVGEFPELQGLMGGYYARAEGLPDDVADAIRDHYKPVGQGDEVPTAPVTVAVSLADKLDTLVSFFGADLKPTGSSDPYALRRAMLGAMRLIQENGLRMRTEELVVSHQQRFVERAMKKEHHHLLVAKCAKDEVFGKIYKFYSTSSIEPNLYPQTSVISATDWLVVVPSEYAGYSQSIADDFERDAYAWTKLPEFVFPYFQSFMADRLKVQQREAGVRHDLIDAVFALGNEDDLVRLLARVTALQNFVATEDGANLLAAYKRAANILKKEDWQGVEGEIARTGEEDPLAEVDDPDLKEVVAAKMAERRSKELSYEPEPAEQALIEALEAAEPRATTAIEAEDFEGAMAALASLREPIDRFFDEVTVNDAQPEKRTYRLELLAQFRAAVQKVADFSRIEG